MSLSNRNKHFFLALVLSLSLHLVLAGIFFFNSSSQQTAPELAFIDLMNRPQPFRVNSVVSKQRKNSKELTSELTNEKASSDSAPDAVNEVEKNQTVGNETSAYFTLVNALIEKHKAYPKSALARELEGRVTIELVLEPSGAIQKISLFEKCPFDSLNEAALGAARSVGQFPATPYSQNIRILVPIQFTIRR